jgi:hypothetical protein
MTYLLFYAQPALDEMSMNSGMIDQIQSNDSIAQFPVSTQHFALPLLCFSALLRLLILNNLTYESLISPMIFGLK